MLKRLIALATITTALSLVAIPAYAGWINDRGQYCSYVWVDTDGDGIGDEKWVSCDGVLVEKA